MGNLPTDWYIVSGIARQAASQGKRHRKASGIASGIVRPVAVR
ncbi:MAG: hypothetical protein ACK6A8_05810 [Planctomycetota bacterium]